MARREASKKDQKDTLEELGIWQRDEGRRDSTTSAISTVRPTAARLDKETTTTGRRYGASEQESSRAASLALRSRHNTGVGGFSARAGQDIQRRSQGSGGTGAA